MRLNFLEHRNLLARHWGNDYSALDTSDQAEVDNAINRCIADISISQRIPLLKKSKILSVVAKYDTGTIKIATSSELSTVTGTLTVWTADMVGRKFIVDSDTIAYTIKAVASNTSLTLEETYINPDDDTNIQSTASDYDIVKDEYLLWNDFGAPEGNILFDMTNRRDIDLLNEPEFNNDWIYNTSITTIKRAVIRGLSEDTYYSTGTVAVSKDSATITGTSTVWTIQMDGLAFRIDGDSTEYIFTYVSATSGTLDRTYQGTTATAATYQIGFSGQRLILFNPRPEKAAHIKIAYFKLLPKLLANNDVCPLPVHNAIISGSRYFYIHYKEKGKLGTINEYYGAYERDLAGLRKISRVYAQNFGFRPRVS